MRGERARGGCELLRKAVWISALASTLVLVTSSIAVAAPALVSGPSPLGACKALDASQPGRNFFNAEAEPQVAVQGTNAIAMWHEDRWSNGGAHGIGYAISGNGGTTWTATKAMPWDACGSGSPTSLTGYLRNSDPWVSFGPDGTAYASALAFNIFSPNWNNSVAVATLASGQTTWGNVQPIPGSVFTQFAQSTDKNATTADPVKKGVAYAVWDTLFEPTDNPDDNPKTSSYTGPAFFSKTVDFGKHWSQAKIIIDTKQRQQTIGNIIVVDPSTGALYDFTNLIIPPNTRLGQGNRTDQQVAFVKSTDGGDTWSAPQIIAPFNALGVHAPNTGQLLRVGDGLAEVAIDPSSGKLYVVWESSTNFTKNTKQSAGLWDDEILLATSSDGGTTWMGPTVIHALPTGLPTFTPTVAVNPITHAVAVTYYDNRNLNGQATVLPTDYWAEVSTDGGVHWGAEQHLAGSFDQLSAAFARGFFLGDYEGLQPSGGGFLAVFVATNCNGPTYTGSFCGPASSSKSSTPNTNPSDVFAASFS